MKQKLFCLAPWVHSYVDMRGSRALCCEAGTIDDSKDLSLNEVWNGEVFKNARVRMLNGSAPSEYCSICLDQPNSSSKPLENFEKFRHLESSLTSQTKEDGTFTGRPVFYDYRISNECNLSCRMCSEFASSKIERGVRNSSSTPKQVIVELDEIKTKNTELFIPELKEAISKKEVTELYFASGEAVLQKNFWEIIDHCIDQDVANQIGIIHHTNLALPLRKIQKHFFKLSKFKIVTLWISIDGAGDSVEFIRDGLKWNRFIQNLEFVKNISNASFSITLTTPTLLNFKSFLNFLTHYKIPYDVTICHDYGISGLMSPISLDRETLTKLICSAEEDIKASNEAEYLSGFSSVLNILKGSNLLEDRREDWREDLKEIFERSDELDIYFKREKLTDYYKKFEITKDWISKIDQVKLKKTDYQKSEKKAPSKEESYWANFTKSLSLPKNSYYCIHKYKGHETLESYISSLNGSEEQTALVCLVGSAPSLLNKILNKSQDQEKFRLYNDYNKMRNDTNQVRVIKREYLGVFKYLFKNHKILNLISGALDILTTPLKKFISFHYYVVLEIKRDVKKI
jgi:hypothetical protein